jgi:hypothetical protein
MRENDVINKLLTRAFPLISKHVMPIVLSSFIPAKLYESVDSRFFSVQSHIRNNTLCFLFYSLWHEYLSMFSSHIYIYIYIYIIYIRFYYISQTVSDMYVDTKMVYECRVKL